MKDYPLHLDNLHAHLYVASEDSIITNDTNSTTITITAAKKTDGVTNGDRALLMSNIYEYFSITVLEVCGDGTSVGDSDGDSDGGGDGDGAVGVGVGGT